MNSQAPRIELAARIDRFSLYLDGIAASNGRSCLFNCRGGRRFPDMEMRKRAVGLLGGRRREKPVAFVEVLVFHLKI